MSARLDEGQHHDDDNGVIRYDCATMTCLHTWTEDGRRMMAMRSDMAVQHD